MLKEERQQRILEILRTEGKVLAAELSSVLEVSEDTIRRDLHDLASANLVQRVHGGALLKAPSGSYTARQKEASRSKLEIARTALQFFQDGQVIILDGGTTTLQIACQLPLNLRATIITNSPPIAVALAEHQGVEVIVVGGTLYKTALVSVGVEAVETFHNFRADLCMLGICSLDTEMGIMVPSREEAFVKRAMIASAAEVVALATAEKLNTAAPYVVGPIKELTHLITEKSVTEEILEPYRKIGISLVQA